MWHNLLCASGYYQLGCGNGSVVDGKSFHSNNCHPHPHAVNERHPQAFGYTVSMSR
jgi:hypothetical protein